MPKKCKVLLNNEVVAVIDYDGVSIQIPPIEDADEYVYVEKNGYTYTVINEQKLATDCEKKQTKKKNGLKKKAKQNETQEVELATEITESE
jgi:hypothetical protein